MASGRLPRHTGDIAIVALNWSMGTFIIITSFTFSIFVNFSFLFLVTLPGTVFTYGVPEPHLVLGDVAGRLRSLYASRYADTVLDRAPATASDPGLFVPWSARGPGWSRWAAPPTGWKTEAKASIRLLVFARRVLHRPPAYAVRFLLASSQ